MQPGMEGDRAGRDDVGIVPYDCDGPHSIQRARVVPLVFGTMWASSPTFTMDRGPFNFAWEEGI